jgi:hypothetical protein
MHYHYCHLLCAITVRKENGCDVPRAGAVRKVYGPHMATEVTTRRDKDSCARRGQLVLLMSSM